MWPSNNGPQYTRPDRNEDILKRQVRSSLWDQTIVAVESKELEFPPNGARKTGSLSSGKRFHSSDNLTAESGTQTMMGQGRVGPHLEICSEKGS